MGVKKIVPVDLGTMQISILCNEVDAETATTRVLTAIANNGWDKGVSPRVLVAQELADMQIMKARMRARV